MAVPSTSRGTRLYDTVAHRTLQTGLSHFLAQGTSAARVLLLIATILSLGLLLSLLSIRWAGWDTYTARGISMVPTIPEGSLILTQSTPAERLRLGDVAVFPAPWAMVDGDPRLVVHRLVHVTPTDKGVRGYTRGDGSQIADPAPTLFTGQVKLVTTVVPYLGYAYTFVDSWGPQVVVLGMGLVLVLRVFPRAHKRQPQFVPYHSTSL